MKDYINRAIKCSQNPAIESFKSQDEIDKGLKAPKAVFATLAVFNINKDSYKLKNN
jgi:hypothetical protein